MAKKESRDVWANRARGILGFGAPNAATGVFDTIQTHMNVGQAKPFKWIVIACSITPNDISAVPQTALAGSLFFQFMQGTHSAFLGSDDPQLICQGSFAHGMSTNGGAFAPFPVYGGISAPIPVFSHKLTFGMVAVDQAEYNVSNWGYEWVYLTAPLQEGELAELLMAQETA